MKFGIKVWVDADAVTAYCYNFEVYVWKNAEAVNRNLGLASKVVIGLTKLIEKKGHSLHGQLLYQPNTCRFSSVA